VKYHSSDLVVLTTLPYIGTLDIVRWAV
jgi:hypothetical protein